jgi:hypothetical protein
MPSGYLHEAYSESFSEGGLPFFLPSSDGWIIIRKIPETNYLDAMGCYPLFCCGDWASLANDLKQLDPPIVSLAIVADPFGNYDQEILETCFPDLVFPYKTHFVVNLDTVSLMTISSNHRRNIKKAQNMILVEKCDQPLNYLDDWIELYGLLIKRHEIEGVRKFSPFSFQQQFEALGLVVFRAVYKKQTIGMLLFYEQGDIAYYHLGAFSDIGYDRRASFGLFWQAITFFKKKGVKYLDLGAGAGVKADMDSGLDRFKKGWASESKLAYFCGRIFDTKRYGEIAKHKRKQDSSYFPAYREGEFK